jgi:amino acid transporter
MARGLRADTSGDSGQDVAKFGYQQELKRALSFWDLLIYGLIFMVPIAPFGIYGYILQGSKGMVALAYVIGLVGMIFTAFSYAQMSRAFPIAGSVYSYAGRGIAEPVGFLAGWAILLDYILVPALLYIVGGTALTAFVPGVPAWVWVLAFIAFNTVVNYLGVEFTARFNRIALVLELAVLALFVVVGIVAIVNGTNGAHFSTAPLYNSHTFSISVVMGAVSVAVLSFLGFDGISTLAEEQHGSERTVGRATVTALLVVGLLFIVQTWVAALIVPAGQVHDLDTAFYDVAGVAGGHWLTVTTAVATALAWGIANALAAQAATSRLLFSMARDARLPRFLAKVHPVRKVPTNATLLVAAISVVVGMALVSRIALLTSLVNFGALFSFLLLHISVVNHHVVRGHSRNVIVHVLSPVIGFLVVGYVWISMDRNAKIGGFSWLIIGLVVLLVERARGRALTVPAVEHAEPEPFAPAPMVDAHRAGEHGPSAYPWDGEPDREGLRVEPREGHGHE